VYLSACECCFLAQGGALMPLLAEALAVMPLPELKQVCITVGPGSFMGLRSGVTMVRTLGQQAPHLRITTVNQFERWADSLNLSDTTIVLPSSRFQVYVGHIRAGKLAQAVCEPKTDAFQSLATYPAPVCLAGSLVEEINWISNSYIQIVDETQLLPLAGLIRRHQRFGSIEPWDKIYPMYLASPNITKK
jgi:tRNA A37 threonylcarbamoyladenosine modification protein TsaB